MAAFGDEFRLTLLTNNVGLAVRAERAGVNRIGIDLERLGKAERQAGQATRLSRHTVEELVAIVKALKTAEPFARVNPIHDGSSHEVEAVLESGAYVIMLPFFSTASEVELFVRLVDGRARVMILLETAAALVRSRDILAVSGVDEVMAGLNDLRLQLGVESHFEVLSSPLMDCLAAEVQRAGLPFSVGGVARWDDSSLPVPSDLVLAQFPRLGATGAWISRSFFAGMPADWDFAAATLALRHRLTEWADTSAELLELARYNLAERSRPISLRQQG